MLKPCKNQKGLTLVELIVGAALLGIFCVACTVLMRPCAQVFAEIQRQSRAQMIADTIVEDLRAELLYAAESIRFAEAGTAENPFAPFAVPGDWADASDCLQSGSALEIRTTDGCYEVMDAGYLPRTVKLAGTSPAETELVSAEKAKASVGRLHIRYYANADYQWQKDTGTALADAYADAFADKFYMDNVVTLEFAVQGYRQLAEDNVLRGNRITALKVEVAVYHKAGYEKNGAAEIPIHTQSAILELANAPILVQREEQFAPAHR